MSNSTEKEKIDIFMNLNTHKSFQLSQKYIHSEHGGQAHLIQGALSEHKKIVDFSASINPLGPSRNIELITEDVFSAISKYPDPQSSELKQVLSHYLKVEESCIVITNGATELIYLIPHLIKKEQEVLVLVPIFSEYQRALKLSKIPVRTIPYDIGKGFEPPIDKLISFLNKNSRIGTVIIGHPNSPTGRLWSQNTLDALAKYCEEKGIFLIIDETFIDFCPAEASALKRYKEFSKLILIRSMTKFFALPGLRLGYGVMDSKWARVIEKFRPPWSVNSLAQTFGLVSLQDKTFIKNSKSFVQKQRRFLFKHLADMPWLKVYPSDTNFLLFRLKVSHEELSKRFYYQLLQEGFILRNCGNFENLDSSYFRISVRNRDENKLLLSKIELYSSSWVTE